MENLFETLGNAFNPKIELKCSQCGQIKERAEQIVYSQGNKVCEECKEVNKSSDKRAYDNDVTIFRN